jgi:hypothetical protein
MMNLIWTANGCYRGVDYKSEADLEGAIEEVQAALFGSDRIYLPLKKKIGAKGGTRNIPDGYLIDLMGKTPRLYVVENELKVHDPLRHIAIQILEFSLSFKAEWRKVKDILFRAIQERPDVRSRCERYAAKHGLRNLDRFLDYLVSEAPFLALVIIDKLPENLELILSEKFQFGVEVLVLSRYENSKGERVYEFEPFLADLADDLPPVEVGTGDVDTVVVPARTDGAQKVFLGEDRWHEIRLHGSMRPQIKYIALYQVHPECAITHVAPVKSIEPWKNTGKYVVNFSEPAREIGPIRLVRKAGRVKALQNLRYTTLKRLMSAKTLDDIW